MGNLGRHDLGVIGAGDFAVSQSIGLSSVRLSWRLLGYHLGQGLHSHWSGKREALAPVPPLGVVERASTANSQAAWLLDIEAWVKARPERRQDVAGLARHLGLSRSAVHRRFLATTGVTARDVLRGWRLQWVREAIVSGPATTTGELARRFGWSDGPHLIRQFQQAFGITPKALMSAIGLSGDQPDVPPQVRR